VEEDRGQHPRFNASLLFHSFDAPSVVVVAERGVMHLRWLLRGANDKTPFSRPPGRPPVFKPGALSEPRAENQVVFGTCDRLATSIQLGGILGFGG